ncbi:MAG: mercury resistance system periplasmic binding protein MerP [Methyloglobulus sp.]|nr:mercury resistance system periplasmic binding protein MerP [Methyloglobulus sp.]
MKTKILLFFLAFAVTSGAGLAARRTVTLDVQNMTCAVCPITVKKALEHVSGVQQVTVDYASKTAIIEFDDTVATEDKLTEATQNAGYPSSIKAGKK